MLIIFYINKRLQNGFIRKIYIYFSRLFKLSINKCRDNEIYQHPNSVGRDEKIK